jgi:hypothetical protein
MGLSGISESLSMTIQIVSVNGPGCHQEYSIVVRHPTKPPSEIRAGSWKNRTPSSVLTNSRDVVLYRCRFEPRRTLDYIDSKSAQLPGDSASGFPSVHGQPLGDWIHPLDREWAWSAIEEAVRAQRSYVLVYRLVGTEGRDKWVWDEGEAFTTDEGRVAGLEGFLAGI